MSTVSQTAATSSEIEEAGKREIQASVAKLIEYFETGEPPAGLFAPDIFADVSLPLWRLQAANVENLIAIRRHGHPWPGELHVERVEYTSSGFTIEFEERWTNENQRWYAREVVRANVENGAIVDMAVYCTGDWDERQQREHADAIRLIRP